KSWTHGSNRLTVVPAGMTVVPQVMSTVRVIVVSSAVTFVKLCFPFVRVATWPSEHSTSVVVTGRPVAGSMVVIVTVPHRAVLELPNGLPSGRAVARRGLLRGGNGRRSRRDRHGGRQAESAAHNSPFG